MSPAFIDLVKLRAEMFLFKFGRPISGNDPIFFDEDADEPREHDDLDEMIATLRAAAQQVGADPEAVVAHVLGADELADYLRRRQ